MLPLSLLRRTSKERGIYVKMLYISITQCCLVQMLTTIHCCCCFIWERAEHKDPHSPRLLSIESPLGLWAPYPQKSYVSESLCGSDQEPSRLSKPLVGLNVWINAFSFFSFFFPTSASIFAVQAFKIMADEYIHCGASQQSFSRITKVALNVYICCISDSLLNYVKLSNWEPEDCLFVFFFPLSINNVLQKNHTCSYLKNIVKQLNNILSKNIWQSMI